MLFDEVDEFLEAEFREIDARGRELFTCITLAQPGTQTVCIPCRPRPRPIAIAPVPAELAGWRPVLALPSAEPVIG